MQSTDSPETLRQPHAAFPAGAPAAAAGLGATGGGTQAMRNLALFIVFGVSASLWVYWRTTYFPALATLLGMGGVFTWAGSVLKLIPQGVTRAVQRNIFRHLAKPAWTVGLAAGIVVVLLLWLVTSTLDVTATPSYEAGLIRVHRPDVEASERPIAPGETVRTTWFGLPGVPPTLRVKASGYPDQPVTLRWSPLPHEFFVPHSFERRAVLFIPPFEVLDSAISNGIKRVKVSLPGLPEYESGWIEDYRGGPIWIGSGSDVPLPSNARERIDEIIDADFIRHGRHKPLATQQQWLRTPVCGLPPRCEVDLPEASTTKRAETSDAPAVMKLEFTIDYGGGDPKLLSFDVYSGVEIR